MARSLNGIDIREFGSGNPGATNVYRAAGRGAGLLTLALDVLKGMVPVLLVTRLFPEDQALASCAGLAAIAGHNWTPFLSFKGGKGVATSIGVFLALIPKPALIAVGCFAVCLLLTRHVSLSSLVGSIGLVVSTAILARSEVFTGLTFICAVLTFVLHKKNISRLIRGEEPKMLFGKSDG